MIVALIRPITLNELEEPANCTTLDARATGNPRFFAQHALTKFIVLPVSAKAVIDMLLILAVINTL